MQGFNYSSSLPEKIGAAAYVNAKNGYRYLVVNVGERKKAAQLDENGFTKEQAAKILARINNPDRSKDVVFTPEEWDAYGIEHGLI